MNDEDHAGSDQLQEVPEGPSPVGENCWMVGARNPASLLQCNTYVRTFTTGGNAVHVCVDPGSMVDYPVIEANIRRLIGDVGQLHSFSLNHQDPDVIGNAVHLLQANPDISVMVTEDVWRLARHMLFEPKRVHFANVARSRLTIIGDQHRWQLVPTPFCHFRGAMAFYDLELRTLFSGDLFGGLNRLGLVHLMAREEDWNGIAQFHQIYMPTREALRYAVAQIRSLDPPLRVIAPQHGHVISGDLVPLFMERMHELLVGHDLLAAELNGTYLSRYREVLREMLAVADDEMGREEVLHRIKRSQVDDGLEQLISLTADEVTVRQGGYSALVKVLARLIRGESAEFTNRLRSAILQGCSERNLPIPPVGAGIEGASPPDTVGPDGIRTRDWWLDEPGA